MLPFLIDQISDLYKDALKIKKKKKNLLFYSA